MNPALDSGADRVLVTGANGHLGKKLLQALAGRAVRALVRSDAALADLREFASQHSLDNVELVKCDYLDSEEMAQALRDCGYVVHLVGIIKESGANTFRAVHCDTSRVLVQALAASSVRRLCYLSLMGADTASSNPCFSSRGEAESLLLAAAQSVLALRIPMVLGEGDYASRALSGRARKRVSFGFRGSSLEQPIYAGDVIRAVAHDIARTFDEAENEAGPAEGVRELAGPESLPRHELVRRAAAVLGRRTTSVSLPLALGLALAWVLEKTSTSPPVSRAMLRVLDHDDCIDPEAVCAELGLELTPLDEFLTTCMGSPQ